MTDRWIWIPKWRAERPDEKGGEFFQHYKERDPKWIKNYTRLLSDDAYLALTFTQRAVLHGLWLSFAASHRQVNGSTAAVSRRLGGRVTEGTLQALNHAGFIEIIASDVLAIRLQRASLEEETETEIDNPLPPSNKGDEVVQATPRDLGTNRRAKAKAAKRQAMLASFVHNTFDEYPEPAMLDELEQRGLAHEEALELIAAELERRTEEAA